jgi:hypothetical protein
MKKIIQFGETVEGYKIAVLNEREIRASAGLLFLATFISLMLILFKGNFIPIKYVITVFLTDFLIRVLLNPALSPTLIIGRLIVGSQVPEYVGARQKKFAWIVGLLLSATMFVLMVVFNSYSIVTGIVCLVCLVFLFFESAFGICLACRFYGWLHKEKAQYCPGETCDSKLKQPIQKTSFMQLLFLAFFIGYIILAVLLFQTEYAKRPHALFGKKPATQSIKK